MNLNFYGIGSSKCGTSTLHDLLRQHPDIYLPRVKETKFLSLNYSKGKEWYLQEYFSDIRSETAVGEIYPCLGLPEAPQRLLETFGKNLKLIVLVRDPVKRLFSNYQGQKRIGKINTGLRDAMNDHPVLLENSLYFKNINRFMEKFPKENLRVYVFEKDFLQNREDMLDDICEFLEVGQFKFDLNIKSNSNWEPRNKFLHRLIYKRPRSLTTMIDKIFPSKSLRQQIRISASKLNAKSVKPQTIDLNNQKEIYNRWFKEDVLELEKQLNRDLSIWYKKYNSV